MFTILGSVLLPVMTLTHLTKDNTWAEIASNRSVIFQSPQIQMGNWFVRMNQVCVQGDSLRTLRTQPHCLECGGG